MSGTASGEGELPGEVDALHKGLRRIARVLDIRSKEIERRLGLTIPQFVVLRAIASLGEVTTGALSAHADLSAATVVTVLDKLEARRLVERYRSGADRRIVHARLTAAGRDVLSAAPSLLPERFVTAFAALQSEERNMLAENLLKLAGLLEVAARDPELEGRSPRPLPRAVADGRAWRTGKDG
ncbi:MarR family winged helix-turn-helix transcriptional regulator [Faunimonas sp. B44]|uniref:MarR family winged helix-turn-helix transcriptional regulator n=1 Tax=Faunimonas sp. B44 TaxID=3461493 RepID=UPI0040443014